MRRRRATAARHRGPSRSRSKTFWSKTRRGPGRDVGGRGQDQRALAAVEVAEGRAVEQDLVVQLGRQFGAAPAGRPQLAPVGRIERAGDELALHVALQEALLVVGEQLVAVQAVGQRREAAARHAGDDVDCVEQADAFAARPDDLGAPQKLQDAVGERRRARAAAGKGEDDQGVLVLEVRLPRPGSGSRRSGRPA